MGDKGDPGRRDRDPNVSSRGRTLLGVGGGRRTVHAEHGSAMTKPGNAGGGKGKISRGEITSHRAVTTVNVEVASKVSGTEGRARNRRAKAA
jgi:hypothetical protein